jgi:hypothetical protein
MTPNLAHAGGRLSDTISAPMPSEPRLPRSTGQIIEYLVWINLMAGATRPVHVFLPLDDRGVDGILRRPDDDSMVALQVKGVTKPRSEPYLNIDVLDESLDDNGVRYVLTLADPGGLTLHDTCLVLDAATIRKHGVPGHTHMGRHHKVDTVLPPPPTSPYAPYATSTRNLADHLLPQLTTPPTPTHPPDEGYERREWMGNLAEVEVMRLLSGEPSHNVFKSFPDIELVEYITRDQTTGALTAIQVKCVRLDTATSHGIFHIRASSIDHAPNTMAIVLGWREDLQDFDDQALLFPVSRMRDLASLQEDGYWMGVFDPRPTYHARFGETQLPRAEVAARIAAGA